MDWPLAVVVEGQPTPRISLVRLDRAFEGPILDQKNIGEVLSLLSEAKVRCAVVQADVVCQLERYGDKGLDVVR